MRYGQDLSRVERPAATAVAALGIGLRAAGPSGALRTGHRGRGTGSVGNRRDVRRGARLSAVPPGHDDGAAAVRLLPADLLLAPHRAGLRGAGGLHGGHGAAATGLPHHRHVLAPPSGAAARPVSAGVGLVAAGGPGRAWAAVSWPA